MERREFVAEGKLEVGPSAQFLSFSTVITWGSG